MAEKEVLTDLSKLEAELSQASAKTAGTKAPTAKKKGKKAAPAAAKSEVLWTVRAEQLWHQYLSMVIEIARGARSPDVPTRRMSMLFLVSFAGFFVVLGYGVNHWWEGRTSGPRKLSVSEQNQAHLGEFIAKQAMENKHKAGLVNLGNFTVHLKDIPGSRPVPGVVNMAEIEIVLETDSKETRVWIEENLPQARNQITNTFTGFDRDEILTREGKRKLKKLLLEKLNTWLIKGKVDDLFFSKLAVS